MENEVVVLPGTISDYGYEDMIPAAKETVPQILAPTLAEFQYYGKQARLLGYQEEALFQVHGLKHILRVLLLSLIYIHNAGDPLSEADRQKGNPLAWNPVKPKRIPNRGTGDHPPLPR